MSTEPIEKPKMLYNIEAAAGILDLPVSKVRRLVKSGELGCRRIGKYLRFSETDLRQFVERAAA